MAALSLSVCLLLCLFHLPTPFLYSFLFILLRLSSRLGSFQLSPSSLSLTTFGMTERTIRHLILLQSLAGPPSA